MSATGRLIAIRCSGAGLRRTGSATRIYHQTEAARAVWEQIERNRRRSVLIVTVMGVLLVGVGMSLGVYFSGQQQGALIGGAVAFGIWLVMWLLHAQPRGQRDCCRWPARGRSKSRIIRSCSTSSKRCRSRRNCPRCRASSSWMIPRRMRLRWGEIPSKAAVAVTIGLLRILNRDELQGVVAHEIGHIKNRDVALMTTAGIMLGAIVIIADIGLRTMWFGGGSRRSRDDSGGGGGAQAIMMIVALVFLILSPILAQLIYFALSRRREYLADASGAMLHAWPEGLASALEKLGQACRLPQADQNQVTAPMYIVRPLRQGRAAESSAPPLPRIRHWRNELQSCAAMGKRRFQSL